MTFDMRRGDLSQSFGTLIDTDGDLPVEWADGEALYQDFLRFVRQCSSQHQVFQLIQLFENLCEQQCNILDKFVEYVKFDRPRLKKLEELSNVFKAERFSWRLLRVLYEDRLEVYPTLTENMDDLSNDQKQFITDQMIHSKLLLRNVQYRELRIILAWCESVAEDKSLIDQASYFSNTIFAWGNTLHDIQQRENFPDKRTHIVAEMDPDASCREGRCLADQDVLDEDRLLRLLLKFVMAGKVSDAADLCVHIGQSWRAALLLGSQLFHDPNHVISVDGTTANQRGWTNPEGNPNRDIWKAACWELAQQPALAPPVERAIFGALSGHLVSVLPVCSSWHECLWGYSLATAEHLFDAELRAERNNDGSVQMLPADAQAGQADFTVQEIFDEIEASSDKEIRSQATTAHCLLQKYIILDDGGTAVERLFEWLSERLASGGVESIPAQQLRFFAHLVLVFRLLHVQLNDVAAHGILELYVQTLIKHARNDLVAFYVSNLPVDSQVSWYAKFLDGIESAEERRACQGYAIDAGLDLLAVCRTVIENFRDVLFGGKELPDVGSLAEGLGRTETSKDDSNLIDRVGLLLFHDSFRIELLRQSNAVARLFLLCRKTVATQQLFDQIPADSVHVVLDEWQVQHGDTSASLLPEDNQTVKEYLCIQTYLEAVKAFNQWFDYYHRRKPVLGSKGDEQSSAAVGKTFMRQIETERRQKNYEQELAQWEQLVSACADMAEANLLNVLLFPDGGWLKDSTLAEDEQSSERQHQLSRLRKLYVPQVFYMLSTVLGTSGKYKKCLQLADLVCAEERQLYLEFGVSSLQEFLTTLTTYSVQALDAQCDAFGYAKKDKQ